MFPARTDRTLRHVPSSSGLTRRREACDAYFAEAALRYDLPIDFLRAVGHVESGFDAAAVSVDGAMGIMQMMPFTANKMGVADPYDARQSILGGAHFLRILANQWHGDVVLTIAAYNAGSGAVKRHHGVPPYKETQRYVRRVLSHFATYARERLQEPPAPTAPMAHPMPRSSRAPVDVVFLTTPGPATMSSPSARWPSRAQQSASATSTFYAQ